MKKSLGIVGFCLQSASFRPHNSFLTTRRSQDAFCRLRFAGGRCPGEYRGRLVDDSRHSKQVVRHRRILLAKAAMKGKGFPGSNTLDRERQYSGYVLWRIAR